MNFKHRQSDTFFLEWPPNLGLGNKRDRIWLIIAPFLACFNTGEAKDEFGNVIELADSYSEFAFDDVGHLTWALNSISQSQTRLYLIQCLPLAGPYDPAPTSSLLPDDINKHHMDEFKPSSSPTVVAFDMVNSTDYNQIMDCYSCRCFNLSQGNSFEVTDILCPASPRPLHLVMVFRLSGGTMQIANLRQDAHLHHFGG